MADSDPAQRLEAHLCREHIKAYLDQALAHRKTAVIDPARIYLAARFNGLKVSRETFGRVLAEFSTKP